MQIEIRTYTKERIKDVIQFENDLHDEENFWGWEIDDEYKRSVISSFDDESFSDSISLLAYVDNRVVGRIDTSMIKSHFDGSTKAYLDWICVIKSYRHQGVAQALLNELRRQLKERQINTLIALTASNEEVQKFYKSIPDSEMKDIGIWIAIK